MAHAHDRHAPSAVPPRYQALYERLRRGQWRREELEWLLKHDPHLPPLVKWVIQDQLNAGTGDRAAAP
jgi:hypothetical protein